MAIGFRTSGMFGPRPQQAAPMVAPNPSAMPIGVQQMTKKPKFFSKDGLAPVVLAGISDFFARQNGDDQNMLGDMVAAKQQMAMQEEDARIRAQLAQQQRGSEWQDWLRKEQWKRENPEPQNDQLTQYMLNAGIDPKSVEGQQMYRKAVENKVNPIQAVPFTDEQGNGGIQFIQPNAMQGGGPQEGQTATNPQTGEKAVYRNGKWEVMGGGVSNGTSGF